MGFVMTNVGGILSTWLFPTTEGPRYLKGTRILLGLTVAMIALIITNSLYLFTMNKKKAKAIKEGQHPEVFGKGDLRTDFKYMI